MARSGYAKIRPTIWADPDFTTLPTDAQRLFLALISQPNLNAAGVIALQPRRWSRLAPDTTPADVEAAIATLAAARFVVTDDDTEELLIRSYVRNDEVWKQPNVMKGAFDDIEGTLSPHLRGELRAELERIPWGSLTGSMAGATQTRAAEVIASLPPLEPSPKAQAEPSPEGFGEPFPEPFEKPFPEGSGEPSGEPLPEPNGEPPVVVAVVGEVEVASSDGSIPKTSSSAAKPKKAAPKQPGKHAAADDLAAKWWDRYKPTTAQTFLAVRGVIRTALSNGLPRDDVARAVDRLGKEGRALSGGSLQVALQQIHRPNVVALHDRTGTSPDTNGMTVFDRARARLGAAQEAHQ